jgi:hypothetical protein
MLAHRVFVLLAVSVMAVAAPCAARAQGLNYEAAREAVPIPPAERGLQTVVAEPWLSLPGVAALEGPAFERNNNLVFSDVSALRRTALLAAALAVGLGSAVQPSARQAGTMNIRLKIGDSVHTATLADSAAARDFAALLPLTLTLEDYNSTEKIADLPRRLSVGEAPDGHDPSVGDITYYAPWGNLAIFYRDFGYSRGLVHLGTIDGGTDALAALGPVQVTIERAE